ncbi:MAG: hypothetical protein ACLVJ6_17940 [Merdibacter sp.]
MPKDLNYSSSAQEITLLTREVLPNSPPSVRFSSAIERPRSP